MKKTRFFKSVAAGVCAATALILSASLTAACSSDVEPGTQEEITFPIYVRGANGNQGQTRAARAENGQAVAWFAPNGEEDINPEGWNDPLGESAADGNGKKKTQFRYEGGTNDLYVYWRAGDQIGIKTQANATSGAAQWTKLALTDGVGMMVASFEGIASSTNGLSPTGSQDIVSVYPFKADGNYSLATQAGTMENLGDYDIRVDQGALVNGTVTDLYFISRISVLRIDKMFFDNGDETKTKGKTQLTVTVNGAGIGNGIRGVCSANEQITTGAISATVAVDPATGKPLEDVYISFAPINTTTALFTIDVQAGNDASTHSRYSFYKSKFETGKMYNLKHPGTDVSETCITFRDPKAEAICLQNYDIDKNGCISYREARSVTYLGQVFTGSDIEWFPELAEFTSLIMIPANAFANCVRLEEIEFPERVTGIGNIATKSRMERI